MNTKPIKSIKPILTILLTTHRDYRFKECINFLNQQVLKSNSSDLIKIIILVDSLVDISYVFDTKISDRFEVEVNPTIQFHKCRAYNPILNIINYLKNNKENINYFWVLEDDVFLKDRLTLFKILQSINRKIKNIRINVVEEMNINGKFLKTMNNEDMCSFVVKIHDNSMNINFNKIFKDFLENSYLFNGVDLAFFKTLGVLENYIKKDISIFSQVSLDQNVTTSYETIILNDTKKYRLFFEKSIARQYQLDDELDIIRVIIAKETGIIMDIDFKFDFSILEFKDLLNYYRAKKDFKIFKNYIINNFNRFNKYIKI